MFTYRSHGGGACRRVQGDGGIGAWRRAGRVCSTFLVTAALALCCLSCAGGGAGTALPGQGGEPLSSPPGAAYASGVTAGASVVARQGNFILYALPGTDELSGQAGRISLEVGVAEQEVVVTARISGAAGLRGICMELAYPSARYRPVAARCGAVLGGAEEQLSLCVTDTPGVAALGAVLKNWPQREGFSGDGELAQVRFARQPFAASRRVSSAPISDEAKARLVLDCTRQRVEWEHVLPGDYDQNGQVGLSDLIPLAMHWGETTMTEPFAFPDPRARLFKWDALSMIDADHDGTIGLPDLAYLGMHWGEATSAYCIYSSLDPAADMPDGNGGADKVAAEASVTLSSALIDADTGRLYFSEPLVAPQDGRAYWERPTDAATVGTPSNYSRFCIDGPSGITVVVEPVSALDGGSAAFGHAITSYAEDISVECSVHNAFNLGAWGIDVTFDPEEYDFLSSYSLSGDPPPQGLDEIAVKEMDGLVTIYRSFYLTIAGEVNARGLTAQYAHLQTCVFTRQPQVTDYQPWAALQGYGYEFSFKPHTGISYNPASGLLGWRYSVPGDYDQNGMVTNNDIIPMSYYYGLAGPFDPGSAVSTIDGNQDGLIGVEDFGVAGRYNGSRVSGYNVYGTSDPLLAPTDEGMSYEAPPLPPIAHVDSSEAIGDPLVDRLQFNVVIGSQPSGSYLWVVPEYKGQTGTVTGGEYVLIL